MLLPTILASDPDFLKKLPLYQSAYAPGYKSFIAIVKVWNDDNGQPIIQGRLAYQTSLTLFRVEELTDFVL